jgi:hypothetical protein
VVGYPPMAFSITTKTISIRSLIRRYFPGFLSLVTRQLRVQKTVPTQTGSQLRCMRKLKFAEDCPATNIAASAL